MKTYTYFVKKIWQKAIGTVPQNLATIFFQKKEWVAFFFVYIKFDLVRSTSNTQKISVSGSFFTQLVL